MRMMLLSTVTNKIIGYSILGSMHILIVTSRGVVV